MQRRFTSKKDPEEKRLKIKKTTAGADSSAYKQIRNRKGESKHGEQKRIERNNHGRTGCDRGRCHTHTVPDD